jgi:hypothetical protein
MARAAARYAFAALLALLSTQVVAPSVRVLPIIEFVCRTEARQQIAQKARCIRKDTQVRQPATAYVSRSRPEPDAVILFQRPPPASSLFS